MSIGAAISSVPLEQPFHLFHRGLQTVLLNHNL